MMFDFVYTVAVSPLSVLYFDIYVCYMFDKITYLLTIKSEDIRVYELAVNYATFMLMICRPMLIVLSLLN